MDYFIIELQEFDVYTAIYPILVSNDSETEKYEVIRLDEKGEFLEPRGLLDDNEK